MTGDKTRRAKPTGKRDRILITAADESRIVSALESWASDGDFLALRTRAFVYLLWDGAVRTKVARFLNVEEVVNDPDAARISIAREVTQRPCEANQDEGKCFILSARARRALGDYLRVVRRDGWLPTRRLEGPLFLSRRRSRISRETLILSWRTLLQQRVHTCHEYQLDDVVYTGRMAFLAAAGDDTESLAQHAGIGRRWAAEYRSGVRLSPADVMAELDKRHAGTESVAAKESR